MFAIRNGSPWRIVMMSDMPEHCQRLSGLVHSIHDSRHAASGGAWPRHHTKQMSLREMGLSLGPEGKPNLSTGTSVSQPGQQRKAVAPASVPTLTTRRSSLFAAKATGGTDVANPIQGSTTGALSAKEQILAKLKAARDRKISQIEQPQSRAEILPKSAGKVDTIASLMEAYLQSFDDTTAKNRCGMMQFAWETRRSRGIANASQESGIGAIFKKYYNDFEVTEIPANTDTLSLDILPPLPRSNGDRNFSIPAIPPHIQEMLGMQTSSDNVFAPVDVEAQLQSAMSTVELKDDAADDVRYDTVAASVIGNVGSAPSLSSAAGSRGRVYYVQAVMRKRRLPHGIAIKMLSQALGVPAHAISFAGIKDYIGDTVQHIRVAGVSPANMLAANKFFARHSMRITLSDFSYHDQPLHKGHLYGNAFNIYLREMTAEDASRLEQSVQQVARVGCLNYFGSQRFSFFAGQEDPILALIKGNWLLFAFRFLNFTDNSELSFVELLQRPLRYPIIPQNQYRHGVVQRLKKLRIEPTVLKRMVPLRRAPREYTENGFERTAGAISNSPFVKEDLVYAALRAAFDDVDRDDMGLAVQALLSFYWNIVVATRFRLFGDTVLVGDIVDTRGGNADDDEGSGVHPSKGGDSRSLAARYRFVTEDTKHRYTIYDVVMPQFTLHNDTLPANEVASIYHAVCHRFGLSWCRRVHILRPFMPQRMRRMFVRPTNVSVEILGASARPNTASISGERVPAVDASVGVGELHSARLRFDLRRGSYASVVLTDILELDECAGMEKTLLRPRPYATEWRRGRIDGRHVRTMESLYDEVRDGTTHAVEGLSDATEGPLVLPESAAQSSSEAYASSERDVSEDIKAWSEYHLVRNAVRHVQVDEEKRSNLFEKAIADTMQVGDVRQYVRGHHIPAGPNSNAKSIRKAVERRTRSSRHMRRDIGDEGLGRGEGARQRYSGPRVARRAQKKSFTQRPSYGLHNIGTWNWK